MPIAEKLKNVQDYKVEQVKRVLVFSNLCNAVLFYLASTIYFLLNPIPSIPGALIAIYVSCFGCGFCCFELKYFVKSIGVWYWRNFGFMFTWPGRLIFLLFVGTICLSLMNVWAYLIGIYTLANLLLNVYIICRHKEYRAYMEDANLDNLYKAQKDYNAQKANTDDQSGVTSALNEWGDKASQMKDAAEWGMANKDTIKAGAEFAQKNPEMAKRAADMV